MADIRMIQDKLVERYYLPTLGYWASIKKDEVLDSESAIGQDLIANHADLVELLSKDIEILATVESTPEEIDENNPTYNNTNRIDNMPYNVIADDLTSSVVLAGSSSQPNRIGVESHYERFTADGIGNQYVLNLPFVSQNPILDNDVIIVKESGRQRVPLTISGGNFSVAGAGTNTVTITITVTPLADDIIDIFLGSSIKKNRYGSFIIRYSRRLQ